MEKLRSTFEFLSANVLGLAYKSPFARPLLLYFFIWRRHNTEFFFFGKLTGSPNCGIAYRDETSSTAETITETRGILSIYVIIDTSLLIYGVTRDTVQRAGRKNLEEEEEEREERESGKKQEERGGPLLYGERQNAWASIYRHARI